MEFTDKDVEYTAKLAMLHFENSDEIKNDMKNILAYVGQLNETDTQNVEPLTHVLENINVFRSDECAQCLSIDETLSNAPQTQDRCFKVPKVL